MGLLGLEGTDASIVLGLRRKINELPRRVRVTRFRIQDCAGYFNPPDFQACAHLNSQG
jgi:hypothetical protein